MFSHGEWRFNTYLHLLFCYLYCLDLQYTTGVYINNIQEE